MFPIHIFKFEEKNEVGLEMVSGVKIFIYKDGVRKLSTIGVAWRK